MADETHREQRRSSTKKHFVVAAGVAIAAVAIAIYANMWKENRRVAEVVVEGNHIISAKDLLALARVPSNALLFDLDLFEIEQRVVQHEYVKSVAVHRDIPNRVRLSVEERVPVAAMVMNGRLAYLDADGIVLPPVRSQFAFDLPVLAGLQSTAEFVAGKPTKNRGARDALYILSVAKEVDEDLYRNISEIRIDGHRLDSSSGNDLVFYTAEAGVPVIMGRSNVGPQFVKFDAFWRSVVPLQGAARLQYIDLRFEDQVVVRWSATRDGSMTSPTGS